MSIRTIVFTVEETGDVSPASPKYAGVQGDHNATTVRFDLPDALYNATWKYRIEYVNGNGCFDSTVFLTPELGGDWYVQTDLPSIWTEGGGTAEIRLCAFEEASGMEMFSAVGRLSFKSRETDGGVIGENSISALVIAADAARELSQDSALQAQQSKEGAAAAAKAAVEAREAAETAKSIATERSLEADRYASDSYTWSQKAKEFSEEAKEHASEAQAAETSAETFRDEAAISANEAYKSELATLTAKDEAVKAAADAQKARDDTQALRDQTSTLQQSVTTLYGDITIKYPQVEKWADEAEQAASEAQAAANAAQKAAEEAAANGAEGKDGKDGTTASQIEPLFVSMIPDLNWVSVKEISAFSKGVERLADGSTDGNNAYFKVTGTRGDNHVTIIDGGNALISDITADEQTLIWGAVLKYDDGRYVFCNARYRDENSLTVYPALTDDITDGELGSCQTGIHLSRRGYRAYAQHIFNSNPKHCEKSKYIAKFRVGDTSPWSMINPLPNSYMLNEKANANLKEELHNSFGAARYAISMPSAYGDKYFRNQDLGVSWTLDLNGVTGYVEAYVGHSAVADCMSDIPTGEEVHIELWLDGVLATEYIQTSNHCERVCLDYSGATTAELKIYQNGWMRSTCGFTIGAVTWWVNEVYLDNTNPYKYKPITMMFDSWGVFHDYETQKELERLNKELSNVYVPITNNSKGSTTVVWGKAMFYENVQKPHNPIMMVDFAVNDYFSVSTQGGLENITAPDGEVLSTNVTRPEYSEKMVELINMAIANGIQPIIVQICTRCASGNTVLEWAYSVIDNWAIQVEQPELPEVN